MKADYVCSNSHCIIFVPAVNPTLIPGVQWELQTFVIIIAWAIKYLREKESIVFWVIKYYVILEKEDRVKITSTKCGFFSRTQM